MANPFLQGMTKLQLPEDMGNMISVEGFCLEADKNRCVEVPSKYAKDLIAQGLVPYVAPVVKK